MRRKRTFAPSYGRELKNGITRAQLNQGRRGTKLFPTIF